MCPGTIIILLLLFVFIIVIIVLAWHHLKPLKWINQKHTLHKEAGELNPTDRYYKLRKKYGRPDLIDKSKGGVAIWKRETLKKRGYPWYRIEIHDEQIPHNDPANHFDFLYTWYPIDIPENKISQVLQISKSIT